MDIHMALQTIREFLEYYVTMGFAVTILTLRNIFVACVTFCTGNLPVFAFRIFNFIVDGAVASATHFIRSIFRIFDDQRSVRGMTDQTILDGLVCRMRFMAFHA